MASWSLIYTDLCVITAPLCSVRRDRARRRRSTSAPLEEHKQASANLHGERDGVIFNQHYGDGVIILKQACARGCDARD
jgi:hypothetical protein